jgi:hypothetical protein
MDAPGFITEIDSRIWAVALVVSAIMAWSMTLQMNYRARRQVELTGKATNRAWAIAGIFGYFALAYAVLALAHHLGPAATPGVIIGFVLADIVMWRQAIKKYSI